MIGIVAIGRNEGERLKRSLSSVMPLGYPVVYVDSGSSDGSADFARSVGAEVVALDMTVPFTAARARNAGVDRLREVAGSSLRYIQFIDGDCEVAPGWTEAALSALQQDDGLAAVAGRRRERAPGATIFNRYCDMEWNTPVGEARALGGDALYRLSAFDQVGGFDPAFICGEEPELCYRLRQQGWRVQRLDHDMTVHDAAMTRWGEFWKRMTRSGWAYAEGAATYGDGPERYNVRERQRVLLWGGVLPAVIVTLLVGGGVLLFTGRGVGWGAVAASILALGLYPVLAIKTAYGRRKARHDSWPDSLLYGALVTVAKIPQFFGLRRYIRTKARGQTARIIEYKSDPEKQR
ncbi:MAG: glycosyltransferase [Parvularcula sp.]